MNARSSSSSSSRSKVAEDRRAEIKIAVTVGAIVEPAAVVVKVIIEASEVAVVVGIVVCITQISHSQRAGQTAVTAVAGKEA